MEVAVVIVFSYYSNIHQPGMMQIESDGVGGEENDGLQRRHAHPAGHGRYECRHAELEHLPTRILKRVLWQKIKKNANKKAE